MTLTQVSTWFANARRRLKKENKWSPSSGFEDDDSSSSPNKPSSVIGKPFSMQPLQLSFWSLQRIESNFPFRRRVQRGKASVRGPRRVGLQLAPQPIRPELRSLPRAGRLTSGIRACPNPSLRHQRPNPCLSPLESSEAQDLVARRDDNLVWWGGRVKRHRQLSWCRGPPFLLKQLLYSVPLNLDRMWQS